MIKNAVIVGVDEAGRGALAGPVVAGACLLSDEVSVAGFIKDSKQLTPEKREEAFLWITEHCRFGFGSSSAEEVDTLGILGATEKAMQAAVAMLAKKITPSYLLVDGRDRFWFDYPHSSVIKGDETEPCISAASIIAKVTRDRMMIEYATIFPQYHFEAHKGYGVEEHYDAIKAYGICSLHRKTFLKSILSELPSVPVQAPSRAQFRKRKSAPSVAARG